MSRWPCFFAVLVGLVGDSGCSRANLYAITNESATEGAGGDPGAGGVGGGQSAGGAGGVPKNGDGGGGGVFDEASIGGAGGVTKQAGSGGAGGVFDEASTGGAGGVPKEGGHGGAGGDPKQPTTDATDEDRASPEICPSVVRKAGDSNETVQVNSVSRTYVLHIPPTYDGTKPAPLIVDFHGIGNSGWSELSSSPFPPRTDPEGVIMAFPDGMKGAVGTAWNFGPCCVANVDDLGFTKALLAQVQKTVCIDPARIYAVGVLTGGGMAYSLACRAADVFAGVATAVFDLVEENVDDCSPIRPITVISFRGLADSRVPYAGGASSLVPGMPITFLGAEATFERWAQIDRCVGGASTKDSNGCSSYSGCDGGADVVLCTKQGAWEVAGDANIAWPLLKRHSL